MPTSTNPKPSLPKPSTASALLSNPRRKPERVGKLQPERLDPQPRVEVRAPVSWIEGGARATLRDAPTPEEARRAGRL